VFKLAASRSRGIWAPDGKLVASSVWREAVGEYRWIFFGLTINNQPSFSRRQTVYFTGDFNTPKVFKVTT
jgi:hypothetical protein